MGRDRVTIYVLIKWLILGFWNDMSNIRWRASKPDEHFVVGEKNEYH